MTEQKRLWGVGTPRSGHLGEGEGEGEGGGEGPDGGEGEVDGETAPHSAPRTVHMTPARPPDCWSGRSATHWARPSPSPRPCSGAPPRARRGTWAG